jgi:hypothetical protein
MTVYFRRQKTADRGQKKNARLYMIVPFKKLIVHAVLKKMSGEYCKVSFIKLKPVACLTSHITTFSQFPIVVHSNIPFINRVECRAVIRICQ